MKQTPIPTGRDKRHSFNGINSILLYIMVLDIILSIISASYTLQTLYDLVDKSRIAHNEYMVNLVKESVEHAYITYIYDIKQNCKCENIELKYDKSKAYDIAHDYFFSSYSRPLFRHTSQLKINKLIRDELRLYRAQTPLTI